MAVSITGGYALGITTAYCLLNDMTLVELCQADENVTKDYHKLLKEIWVLL